MLKITFCFIIALAVGGCATTGRKFSKIYPGMSSSQVSQVMKRGPFRTEGFKEDYHAWYYGEGGDYCVLLHKDNVFSLSRSEVVDSITIDLPVGGQGPGPSGSYHVIKKALCIPPGVDREPRTEKVVHTPFGVFRKKT